jgi:hypothetical protein
MICPFVVCLWNKHTPPSRQLRPAAATCVEKLRKRQWRSLGCMGWIIWVLVVVVLVLLAIYLFRRIR